MNYDTVLSRRVASVPPSGIRKFFDIVSEMEDVISLGVGEPDFDTPWSYTDAAIYSLRRGNTHYTSNWGNLSLRKLISRYEAERFGAEYDPANEILVTVGASEGIDLALRALIEPGDEVIVPDPSYVSYMPCITFAGGVCVPVKTDAEHEFKLTPEALQSAITGRTKALILPYPNNPTGAVLTKAEMEKLAKVLLPTDVVVIADEIYGELTYGEQHAAFASVPGMRERTITLNGFSKAFAMTGWRMGYAAGPKELMRVLCLIHQYTMLCAPVMGQYAAEEALKKGFEDDFADVRRMREAYGRRRNLIVKGLEDAGLPCANPQGAFYAFPTISSTGLSAQEFCERLLYEKKVAAVPGDAFGAGGSTSVRMSYATSDANIVEAVRRIAEFAESIR